MLKEKEPVKKELYHVTYLRMKEKEKKERERKKRQAEKRREQLEKAEHELLRGKTLSNIPVRHAGSSPEALVTDLNINVNRAQTTGPNYFNQNMGDAMTDPSHISQP